MDFSKERVQNIEEKLQTIGEYTLSLICFAFAGLFLGDIRHDPTTFSCVCDMLMSFNLFLLALSYL